MEKVLLSVNHSGNRKLLLEWLTENYEVVEKNVIEPNDYLIDICIVDGISLSENKIKLAETKKSALPLFVPVLFITRREDIGMATNNLWKTIDELIMMPVEKIELKARVQSLLRIRKLSEELRNRDAEILKNIEERYHLLFNLNPDSLFIVDSNGSLRDSNESASELYGFSGDEFKNMKIIDLATKDFHDQIEAQINSAFKSGTAFECRISKKDGTEIPVEIRTKSMATHEEQSVILSIHNISERKETEGKIRTQLDELKQWHTLTIGREEHLMELKEEVNILLNELGRRNKYPT